MLSNLSEVMKIFKNNHEIGLKCGFDLKEELCIELFIYLYAKHDIRKM